MFGKLFRPSDTSAFFFLSKLLGNQAFIDFYARADSDFSSKLTRQQLNLKIHKESIKSQSILTELRLEESKLTRKAFDRLLLEAVDEALASLGDSAKQAIYFYLEDKFKIARNEIPQRVEDFADGLQKIFGIGARFLEILIMKRLHERIESPLEWDESKELVFVEYIAAAKHSFLKGRKRS